MGKLSSIVGLLLAIAAPVPASGATWHVRAWVENDDRKEFDGESYDTAFITIKDGIKAASNGETVIVYEGTYKENVHFEGKNIILRSVLPPDPDVRKNTVIGGEGTRYIVIFRGIENAPWHLDVDTRFVPRYISRTLFKAKGGVR